MHLLVCATLALQFAQQASTYWGALTHHLGRVYSVHQENIPHLPVNTHQLPVFRALLESILFSMVHLFNQLAHHVALENTPLSLEL